MKRYAVQVVLSEQQPSILVPDGCAVTLRIPRPLCREEIVVLEDKNEALPEWEAGTEPLLWSQATLTHWGDMHYRYTHTTVTISDGIL